jgi:hypothetical protein
MEYEIEYSNQLEAISPITKIEVMDTIKTTKCKKAAGPDGFYDEHLQESAQCQAELWSKLFNKCLESGNIPELWRKSTIITLYKDKGETNDPNSYRGIALESYIFKLLTRILTNRIVGKVNPKIPEKQFGFRRGRGTLHAIQNLLNALEDTKTLKGKILRRLHRLYKSLRSNR